jgi:hypothetical protein
MVDERISAIDNAKWWAVIARGAFGFRFGPYSGPEIGEIMRQCEAEGINLVVSAECGRDFDWETARAFGRGQEADWQGMSTAPKNDQVPLIGDVSGVETRMVWYAPWEAWRRIADDGTIVGPVEPRRWRAE